MMKQEPSTIEEIIDTFSLCAKAERHDDDDGPIEAAYEAIVALRAGDLLAASQMSADACLLEAEQGDCPVWAPLRDAIGRHV